jgi:PAS domain S-box-containing protein
MQTGATARRGNVLSYARIQPLPANLSLRIRLILFLGLLILLATASLGSIAYRTSRYIMVREAIREVGITATARKDLLVGLLTEQRTRAAVLFKTADLSCDNTEIWCLRRLLKDFVATEGASAARLVYPGAAPVTVGNGAAILATVAPPAGNQIAHFGFDQQGQPYYVIQARSEDGAALISIRGDIKLVSRLFLDRYGLGQSAETFLTDAGGFFLTPPRYPIPGGEGHPIGGKPMQQCLAGTDGEILDRDYRGVPAIHGFRHVPEIGGGCVMARIDQSEAFAPTRRVRNQVAGVSAVLAVLAIGCSFMLAQLVSRPLDRLTIRTRSLQAGDFDSPVPIGGPGEVQTFARTFQAMADSLKSSRSALEESNEQIKNILESISDGFIAVDQEWRCTYANGKATELSRIPSEEMLGNNIWDMRSGAENTAIFSELHRAMRDKVPVHFEEYYAPLGAWFQIDGYPTRSGLAVFGRDVTERKRFSEQLLQTQKLESLGLLAGGVAHDFNNLLTAIMGYASLLRALVGSEEPAKGMLHDLLQASETAAHLTRQLLAYSGRGRFVVQPLNLSKLVKEAASLLQVSIPKNVQLQLQVDPGLPSIEADAGQMQQLIMNLVINGAEAISEGESGSVLVRTAVQDVDEDYIQTTFGSGKITPGTYVTLQVRDTGSGMDAETQAKIFDPFFTTKFTGRGLGLAAVLGIVRGHKGALKVYSSPGRGTTFKVLFPACEATPSRVESGAQIEADHHDVGTVLVIDDEEMVRRVAKSMLESYGYSVLVASDGNAAIEIFKEVGHEISVVLLDLTMPSMSGEETFRQLRMMRSNVPVILSSGYNEVEAVKRFTGKSLTGFIQKPYTTTQLAQKVRDALNERTSYSGSAGSGES